MPAAPDNYVPLYCHVADFADRRAGERWLAVCEAYDAARIEAAARAEHDPLRADAVRAREACRVLAFGLHHAATMRAPAARGESA